MDMNMNMTSPLSNSTVSMTTLAMMPFHTIVGFDILYFASWMPTSVASTFGACVGLFLLAGLYRFLAAIRATADLTLTSQKLEKLSPYECGVDEPIHFPPFHLKTDLTRGILEGVFSLIGYLLMIAVMAMNAWFFIAIILGIIAGETSFGRFGMRGLEKNRGC